MRDVRQGPDGYLYILTDEDDAVLLRVEPARAIVDPPGANVLVGRLREPRVSPLGDAELTDRQREVVDRYQGGWRVVERGAHTRPRAGAG